MTTSMIMVINYNNKNCNDNGNDHNNDNKDYNNAWLLVLRYNIGIAET